MKTKKGQIKSITMFVIVTILLSFVAAGQIQNNSSNATTKIQEDTSNNSIQKIKDNNSKTENNKIYNKKLNETERNISIEKIPLENISKNNTFKDYLNTPNNSLLKKDYKLNSTPLTNETALNFSEGIQEKNLSFENKTKKTEILKKNSYYYLGSQESSQKSKLEKKINKAKNQTSEKKVKTMLSQNGQVQIEADLPESFNVNNIKKKETQKNKNSKEVIVSSTIHVTEPLTVYSNIPEISKNKKNNVRIFWVNENKNISPKEFYDTNKNGEYDRISWVVPHLSTQIFEVNVTNESGSSSNITIIGPSGIYNNSIIDFKINSSSTNISCQLNISGTKKNESEIISFDNSNSPKFDLPNGDYNWTASCSSGNNSKIENGTFKINDTYSEILGGELIYIIDENGNLIKNPNTTLTWNSSGNSSPDLYLYSLNSGGGSNMCTNTTSCTNNSNNSFNLAPYLNSVGNYQFVADFSGINKTMNFSVTQINLTSDINKTETGKEINFKLNVGKTNSVSSDPVALYFGDGDSTSLLNKNFPVNTKHKYNIKGNYTATAYITINSELYNITKKITITDPVNDTQKPKITMITPTEGETLNTSSPTFSYKATDNIGIGNCSFYLYGPDNNGIENTPITDNPSNNTKITHEFSGFQDGTYSWDVTCYDSHGNFVDAIPTGARQFKISTTNSTYPHKAQIENANKALTNFSKREESLKAEEIDALEDLGIMNNLTKVFPKQINSIMQFFQTNQSSFITDSEQKEKTINNNIKELNYISSHIPDKVAVSNQQKFVKNSISQNMAGIVKTYEEYLGNNLEENEIKSLAIRNEPLQKYITTLTESRDVEINYPNSTKKTTLVTKKINASNSTYDVILEAFPDGIKPKIFFLPSKTKNLEVKKISDTLYEIPQEYLQDNNGKLIYYFDDSVGQDTIKKIDTVLFKKMAPKSVGITGLSVIKIGKTGQEEVIVIIFGIFLLIYLGKKGKEKINLSKWKKEENVRKVLRWVEVARSALKEDNDPELAKQSYHKIKGVFLLTPEGFREYIRKEIDKIRKGIDRREIIGFVKEYEKAKVQGRENDAQRLYKEIKATYKRLPKKDQEKIYNKMFRRDLEI